MTLDHLSARPAPTPTAPGGYPRAVLLALVALVVGVLAWALSYSEKTIVDQRLRNPDQPVPLPTREWAGLRVDHFWIPFCYLLTVVVTGWMVTLFVRHWKRTGRVHPGALIFVAVIPQFLMDPIYNWAMFVAYDPQLIHWPTSWPIMNIAPTVEPVWVLLGAYQAWYLAPAIGVLALYRRVVLPQAQVGGFLLRHPILSIVAFATSLGIVYDILLELWLLNIGFYKYPQIIGPQISWGNGHLAWTEILWTAVLVAMCAALMHCSDNGRSTIATRVKSFLPFLRRHRVGDLAAVTLVVALGFLAYGGVMAALRVTDQVTTVILGALPYPQTKTYDPHGRLQQAGTPGPYYPGTWCIETRCRVHTSAR
jgi:hypothetical protein